MAVDGTAESLQRLVPSFEALECHREVDVGLELAGLEGDCRRQVGDGVLVAAPPDSHHASVDQHDVSLLVVEAQLVRPAKVFLGEVKLVHLALGEPLE